jgi:hypothetical protein
MSQKFREIEHKYLVDGSFDLRAFEAVAHRLKPRKSSRLTVTDTYHVVEAMPGHVIRHRIDQELQQLTLKSTGPDNECRTEVNLDLGLLRGNQAGSVEAFIQPMRPLWSGSIEKKIYVFYFDECEVVHYSACSGSGKVVHCVEFEALSKDTTEQALSVISRFEAAFGFDPGQRCNQSLFELLFTDDLPEGVRKFMKSRR